MTKHHQILESLRGWQEEQAGGDHKAFRNLNKTVHVYREFIEGLIKKLSAFDPSLLHTKASDCLMKVADEVAMDAFLAPGGEDSKNSGFYLSLRPGQSFIALGYLANTFVNSFAIHQEKQLQEEELDYMLHFLTTYCGFELLTGRAAADTPGTERLKGLGLADSKLAPWLLFKCIPHEELMDSQLENWLAQQYGLLLSYNQYLNRALDFYAHVRLDELEDYVDLP